MYIKKSSHAPLKNRVRPPRERDPQVGNRYGSRFNNRMSAQCTPINYKLMQFTNFN